MSKNLLFVIGIIAFYVIGIRGLEKAPVSDPKSTTHKVTNDKGETVEVGGGGRKFGDEDEDEKETVKIPSYYDQLKRYDTRDRRDTHG